MNFGSAKVNFWIILRKFSWPKAKKKLKNALKNVFLIIFGQISRVDPLLHPLGLLILSSSFLCPLLPFLPPLPSPSPSLFPLSLLLLSLFPPFLSSPFPFFPPLPFLFPLFPSSLVLSSLFFPPFSPPPPPPLSIISIDFFLILISPLPFLFSAFLFSIYRFFIHYIFY